jgi:subtilisin family serine protease
MHYDCRVAILDSGINAQHEHVGNIISGIEILPDKQSDDYLDYLGHGTAVAGAIHEKAPTAGLLIVKIFHTTLTTTIHQLIVGLEWALDNRADVINLSLGTTNPDHRPRLEAVVQRALSAGCSIVSPRSIAGGPSYPGSIYGAVGVEANPAVPRDQVRFEDDVAIASPYPRPIPGLPPEQNFRGVSFAAANVSGYLCAQRIAAQFLSNTRKTGPVLSAPPHMERARRPQTPVRSDPAGFFADWWRGAAPFSLVGKT